MRPQLFLSLVALVALPAVSAVAFIYPPESGSKTDFSTNLVMVEGDFKIVQWTNVSNPNNARISVTMFQLNGTQFIGDPEYITQNSAPDTLTASWTVNTKKDLSISPMFYFNLFLEGETISLTNSRNFNITAKSTTTSSTTSSTSSQTSSTSSTTSSQTSTPATSAATSPWPSPSPSIVVNSSLGTKAKVGIAVGVLGAALLGLLAGWLILGKKKNAKNMEPLAHPPMQNIYYDPMKAEQQPQQYPQQQYPFEVSSELAPPVRYELSPEARP